MDLTCFSWALHNSKSTVFFGLIWIWNPSLIYLFLSDLGGYEIWNSFVSKSCVLNPSIQTQPLVIQVPTANISLSCTQQTGPEELTTESLGVNYRALSDLFSISEQRKDSISYDVSVQMVEIYNEQVRDLLINDGINTTYPCSKLLVLFHSFFFWWAHDFSPWSWVH